MPKTKTSFLEQRIASELDKYVVFPTATARERAIEFAVRTWKYPEPVEPETVFVTGDYGTGKTHFLTVMRWICNPDTTVCTDVDEPFYSIQETRPYRLRVEPINAAQNVIVMQPGLDLSDVPAVLPYGRP